MKQRPYYLNIYSEEERNITSINSVFIHIQIGDILYTYKME